MRMLLGMFIYRYHTCRNWLARERERERERRLTFFGQKGMDPGVYGQDEGEAGAGFGGWGY